MNTYLLYQDVRLHGETFEAGEVVEYKGNLDPSLALLVKDYDGAVRKLSLIQGVYVYDEKTKKTVVSDPVGEEDRKPKPVQHIQKSKKK